MFSFFKDAKIAIFHETKQKSTQKKQLALRHLFRPPYSATTFLLARRRMERGFSRMRRIDADFFSWPCGMGMERGFTRIGRIYADVFSLPGGVGGHAGDTDSGR
jgi:hypothetical protein